MQNPNDSQDNSVHAAAGAHVNVVRVELGKETLVLVLALALVIAANGIVMGYNMSRQSELQAHFDELDRQSRITELKLDDWGVTARRAGLALPGDFTRGPQGNMDAESFNMGKEKGNGSFGNHHQPRQDPKGSRQ